MAHVSELIAADIQSYLKSHEHKGLIRFITCGSVDDGKSTLLGRLLHESGNIYDDQATALAADSKRVGTRGDEVDYALLFDGLMRIGPDGLPEEALAHPSHAYPMTEWLPAPGWSHERDHLSEVRARWNSRRA